MSRILIIDDDKTIGALIKKLVKSMDHVVTCAYTLGQGLELVFSNEFDVVFLDVQLPDGNGLEALPKINTLPYSPEVIIITASVDSNGAELAIENGAWDYIDKTYSAKEIFLSLDRALKYRKQKIRQHPQSLLDRNGIIGSSHHIQICLELVSQAANSNASVLITGETGTGKEMFAKAIHLNSHRAGKSFTVCDCSALPETLVESILFGHEKGAFTGARADQIGLVKQADGGTLFLDEIGELPLAIQKSFLRVLQEKRFRPVGGKKEVISDFRLIAATNRDLHQMVKSDLFRKDLLFRVLALEIKLPKLKEIQEDIQDLAIYYVKKVCKELNMEPKGFSNDFFDVLQAYNWPGNIRELVNTIEKTIAGAYNEPILYPKHLPAHIRVFATKKQLNRRRLQSNKLKPSDSNNHSPDQIHLPKLKDYLNNARTSYLQKLISHTQGNIKDACKVSGLSRAHLYELFNKHHLR